MLYSWKFASNGVWEQALNIDATKPINMGAIEEWVLQQPQNVALEAIFAQNDAPATMFGIRITHLPKLEQAKRIKQLLLETPQIKTETDFLKIAGDIFPEFPLFSNELTALNIGIVSQWYSVGPEILWEPTSQSVLAADELHNKAPRFSEVTRNPAAVEFWYTTPIDHWYKIYVSDVSPEGYKLNTVKYQKAIDRLEDFKSRS